MIYNIKINNNKIPPLQPEARIFYAL